MLNFKREFYFILLSIVTFLIWLSNSYSFILAIIFYPSLFIYLIIKKKPISDFIIVILFSVMSIKIKTGIYKIDYILTTTLFFYILITNIKNKFVFLGNLFIPLVIYLLYNLLSILWTPIKTIGFEGIVAMLEGYMMYYIVTNSKFIIKKEQFIYISKLASLIVLTISFEIFTIYLELGPKVILQDKDFMTLKWGSSNLVAAIFVLLIPIVLCKYLNKTNYFKLYIILDIISLIGLISTLSRGAYFGVIVSLLLIAIFYIRKQLLIKYGIVFSIFAFTTLLLLKIFNIYDKLVVKIVDRGFFTSSDRFPLYHLALDSFLDKLIFGNGIKSSEYLISTYLNRTEDHFHNFILQIASTLGIIGIILFIYIVYKWILVLNKPKEPFVMLVTFSLVGALTHQMVDVSFDLHYFGVYFYLLIGIVEIYRHNQKDDTLKMKVYKSSDIIVSNRLSNEIADVETKVYTRDLYNKD